MKSNRLAFGDSESLLYRKACSPSVPRNARKMVEGGNQNVTKYGGFGVFDQVDGGDA